MKKTLIAALVITAGVGGQAFAQGTAFGPYYDGFAYGTVPPINKVGVLSVSLINRYQAYNIGNGWGVSTTPARGSIRYPQVAPFQAWDTKSYEAIANCVDQPTKYITTTKTINNQSLISAINAAFSRPVTVATGGGLFKAPGTPVIHPNIYQGGSFTTSAKIVVINYENRQSAPPYPPSEDNYYAALWLLNGDPVWNAPYNLSGAPIAGVPDGQNAPLNWPNENYTAWGKPFTTVAGGGLTWIGNKVYIIDPNNGNANLRCFDVTPFFEFSEAFCLYCWDTFDRVTDGIIQGATSVPPCSPAAGCGQTGRGTTRWYWTVKFNNIGGQFANANFLLDLYYANLLGVPADWYVLGGGATASDNGTILNGNDVPASKNALAFSVSGIATYAWAFKVLNSQASAPMGTISMVGEGHGYSPLCGVYNGPVSLTDTDKASKTFNNNATKSTVICF